jgi:hypothetical protein
MDWTLWIWAKVNLSSFKLILSCICHNNEKLIPHILCLCNTATLEQSILHLSPSTYFSFLFFSVCLVIPQISLIMASERLCDWSKHCHSLQLLLFWNKANLPPVTFSYSAWWMTKESGLGFPHTFPIHAEGTQGQVQNFHSWGKTGTLSSHVLWWSLACSFLYSWGTQCSKQVGPILGLKIDIWENVVGIPYPHSSPTYHPSFNFNTLLHENSTQFSQRTLCFEPTWASFLNFF